MWVERQDFQRPQGVADTVPRCTVSWAWTVSPMPCRRNRASAKRGPKGVRLVISDAHEGLSRRSARCSVGAAGSAAACTSCAICSRPCLKARASDRGDCPNHFCAAGSRLRPGATAERVGRSARPVSARGHGAGGGGGRHLGVPPRAVEHQRQLHSTNPLERLNKEIKRRSNVVGIFPNAGRRHSIGWGHSH